MIRSLRYFALRCCVPAVSAGLLLALPVVAQNAPSTAAPAGGGMPMQGGPGGPGGLGGPAGPRVPYKPKNLKVLPDNTDLRKVMRGFAGALGVECEFCHMAPDPVTHRPDRSADTPMKEQARAMIQMTDDINQKYLTLLAKDTPTYDAKDAEVTCGTCHRGQKHPSAFVPPPRPERGPGGMGGPGGPGAGPGGASPAGAPPTGVAPTTRQ